MDKGIKLVLCGILVVLIMMAQEGVPLKEQSTLNILGYAALFMALTTMCGVYS